VTVLGIVDGDLHIASSRLLHTNLRRSRPLPQLLPSSIHKILWSSIRRGSIYGVRGGCRQPLGQRFVRGLESFGPTGPLASLRPGGLCGRDRRIVLGDDLNRGGRDHFSGQLHAELVSA